MRIKVWVNAFIPQNVPGVTHPIPSGPFAGQTFVDGPPIPLAGPRGFLTSNRTFSTSDSIAPTHSKMHSEFVVDFGPGGPTLLSVLHVGGLAVEINPATFAQVATGVASTARMITLGAGGLPIVDPPGSARVSLKLSAAIPLIFGSSVVADMDVIGFVLIDPTARTIAFDGRVDSFPAYEAYFAVDGGPPAVLFRQDVLPGKTPSDLIGFPNLTPLPGRATF